MTEQLDTEALDELLSEVRQLGDLKHECSVEQCKKLAPHFGNRKALSYMAKELEASAQRLVKWAGAGAVGAAGYWPEDEDGRPTKPTEWAYQLSLWPRDRWKLLYEWDGFADLSPADLRQLRIVFEKLQVVGKRLFIEDAGGRGNGRGSMV